MSAGVIERRLLSRSLAHRPRYKDGEKSASAKRDYFKKCSLAAVDRNAFQRFVCVAISILDDAPGYD